MASNGNTPLSFDSTSGNYNISQIQSNGLFDSTGGLRIDTNLNIGHPFSDNNMMLGYLGSDEQRSRFNILFIIFFILAAYITR
jgi:hypothetical protein